MKTIECQQLSPEWFEAGRGIATASNFKRICTPKKMQLSAQAQDYICELIAERLGWLDMRQSTLAMQNGVVMEEEARKWYAFETGFKGREVGFCKTDDDALGCSPDWLVDDSPDGPGGCEIKCPLGKTHVSWLLAGTVPDEYKPQVHGSLIVTGRPWWDFVSYARGLPPLMLRVRPDEYTESLRKLLVEFGGMYRDAWQKVQELSA